VSTTRNGLGSGRGGFIVSVIIVLFVFFDDRLIYGLEHVSVLGLLVGVVAFTNTVARVDLPFSKLAAEKETSQGIGLRGDLTTLSGGTPCKQGLLLYSVVVVRTP
jgi:hypothetical protein